MFKDGVQIGWLDFSEAEQRRAREYLRQFRTEGTIDELGFGIIRDAIADIFFPATSTIMTSSRYLFFVAAILLRVEQEKLSGARAAARMKHLEDELRKLLSGGDSSGKQSEKKGVIGALAKENLRRYPSSIYWNALKLLSIFLRPTWSPSYYFEHLAEFYKASTPKTDDDSLLHLAAAEMHNWDPALRDILCGSCGISEDLEFLPGITFSCSSSEAQYLKSRFEATYGSSLLTHLLVKKYDTDFAFPWETPCSEALRPWMDHSRAFSMFTKGATLQYYEMLIAEQKVRGMTLPVETFEEPFAQWWKLSRNRLADWKVEEFFLLLNNRCRIRPSDRLFLNEWQKLCVEANDGNALLKDQRARDLIRKRERAVRPSKHRLGQDKYLRLWKSPTSLVDPFYTHPKRLPYLLDYRSNIGGRFVREIVDGLKEKP